MGSEIDRVEWNPPGVYAELGPGIALCCKFGQNPDGVERRVSDERGQELTA